SPALQVQVVACKEEDRETRRSLRDQAMDRGTANERADMGTGLHAMTARIEDLSDIDFDPPEQYLEDLRAYTDCLDHYGLVSEMVEVPMCNDEFRAAGHPDRIYGLRRPLRAPDAEVLEPGELVLGDIKTGQKLDFSLPGFAVQMAIYATGQLYDLETNKRLPTPPINQRWTLLVPLPFGTGRCELLWVPIETGVQGALFAMDVRDWRKRWKRGDEGYDALVVDDPLPALRVVDPPAMERIPMGEMTEFALYRVRAIGEIP